MINLFRKLSPVNFFLLAFVAVLLRLGVFFDLPEMYPEPFARLFTDFDIRSLFTPSQSILVAALLVFIQALLFNTVINEFNLLGKPTLLPALMYVTVSSLFSSFLIVSPPLICNFLVIWMISKFFSVYHREEARSAMFDLSMMVAVGSLLYFPFIAMLPLLWISLIIFRPFNWREWTAVLIGFITVYFFLAVFCYWNDAMGKFYTIWLPLRNHFPVRLKINFYDYIVLIPPAAVLILSVFSLQQNFFRSYVQVRKSLQLLFFMFLLALFSFYLKSEFSINHFILAALPASVFMAYYFLNARVRWFYESIYIILAVMIIYLQIF